MLQKFNKIQILYNSAHDLLDHTDSTLCELTFCDRE